MSIYEAKTNLSKYIELVNSGEEVSFTNRGKLVARLMPPEAATEIRLGIMAREWPDWDPSTLDAEVAAMFRDKF